MRDIKKSAEGVFRLILITDKTLQEVFEAELCQARQRPKGIMKIYAQGR